MPKKNHLTSAFTLVELAIGIALIVALSMAGIGIGSRYQSYENGLQVGAALKTIRSAQLAYLSDNPASNYSNISLSDSNFQSYLPSGELSILTNYPTAGIKCNGQAVTLVVTTYPPTATTNGVIISTNTDGVWNSGP